MQWCGAVVQRDIAVACGSLVVPSDGAHEHAQRFATLLRRCMCSNRLSLTVQTFMVPFHYSTTPVLPLRVHLLRPRFLLRVLRHHAPRPVPVHAGHDRRPLHGTRRSTSIRQIHHASSTRHARSVLTPMSSPASTLTSSPRLFPALRQNFIGPRRSLLVCTSPWASSLPRSSRSSSSKTLRRPSRSSAPTRRRAFSTRRPSASSSASRYGRQQSCAWTSGAYVGRICKALGTFYQPPAPPCDIEAFRHSPMSIALSERTSAYTPSSASTYTNKHVTGHRVHRAGDRCRHHDDRGRDQGHHLGGGVRDVARYHHVNRCLLAYGCTVRTSS